MSASSLRGKVMLITGAAGGFGRAAAVEFAGLGALPVMADLDGEGARRAAAEAGPETLALELDVTDREACGRAVEATLDRHGRLDVVWANAGISAFGQVELLDPAIWAKVVEVNLTGAYNTVQAALPAIIEARGYVAITCSLASFSHQPGMSAYAASKAGAEALANSLRIEVAHQGVDVGTIHPGWTDTGMVAEKEAHQRAYMRLRETVKGPFRATSPLEKVLPDVVGAFTRRSQRVVTPRPGWLAHALRPLLNTRPFTRETRAAAPEIRRLFEEQSEREGHAAAISERFLEQVEE